MDTEYLVIDKIDLEAVKYSQGQHRLYMYRLLSRVFHVLVPYCALRVF